MRHASSAVPVKLPRPSGPAAQSLCSEGIGLRGGAAMPSGAAVIRYEGPRGVSWRIKYPRTPQGRQVKETLGREPESDRRKAERALGAHPADVDEGMRKPKRRTFNDLADEFEQVGLGARPRKKSTVIDYKATLRNHLRPRSATTTSSGSHDHPRRSSSTPPTRSAVVSHRRPSATTSCWPGGCSAPRGGGGGQARTRSTSSRHPRCRTRKPRPSPLR